MSAVVKEPVHSPGYTIPGFVYQHHVKITYLPNGWGVALIDVDPELAEVMLGLNANNQRNVIWGSVTRFSNDMTSNKWQLTHQGLAFNRKGELHDGQNRLHSIIQSGCTVRMLVFFGAGDETEMAVIDTGKSRTAVDAAHVFRIDVDRDTISTIVHAYKFGRRNRNYTQSITHSHTIDLVTKYGESSKRVNGWFGTPNIRGTDRAPIRAAVFTAMICGVPASVLERFVGILTEKIPATEPGDSAAQLLKRFVINNTSSRSGSLVSNDLFLRTVHAISYAASGREVGVLRPPSESPYLLPAEDYAMEDQA